MADTETTIEQPRLRTLKNGAVYDMELKRIVANPGGGSAAITSATASQLHARRQELKRERLMAGAARALERSGDWQTPSDLDVVEAIGEAITEKALDPSNAKQVDAARFLFSEAGLLEQQAQPTAQAVANAMTQPILVLLAELQRRDAQIHETIDADIVE